MSMKRGQVSCCKNRLGDKYGIHTCENNQKYLERRLLTPENIKNGNKILSRAENVGLEIAKERVRDIEDQRC